MAKLRVLLAFVCLVLVVLVDFTSRILSTLADGVLVVVIVAVVWPLFRPKKKESA